MKGCGKAVTLFLGIILGVVLTFGGIAFGGFLLLTKDGMVGELSDRAGDKLPFEFTEEAKGKSILNYGMDIFAAITNVQGSVLSDVEAALGVSGLVEKISSFTGIAPETLRASRLSNLTEDLSNAFTLGGFFNAFGITPPDLPLFSREDVLNTPALQAFENLGDFVLGDFVKITTEGEDASNPILIKLKDTKIDDLSNGMESIIREMKLEELTKIVTDEEAAQAEQDYMSEHGSLDGFAPLTPSSPIMQTFKRKTVTLGDMMDNMDALLQEITMKEMTKVVTQEDLDADAAAYEAEHGSLEGYEPRELSSPFLLNLKDVTLGDLMNDMDGIINDMTLGEIIEIDENSNAALIALKETKVGELGGPEADATIKGIKIADLVAVTEESSEVMKYFRDNETTLAGIDDAIKKMRIGNIVKIDENSTVLMRSIRDAGLDTHIDDNGTPEDQSDDVTVLGIEDTIKTLPLSGIIEIGEESSRIMQSLAGATLETYTDEHGVVHKGIDDTARILTLSQMIDIVTDEQAAENPELTPSSKFLQALKDSPLQTYTDEGGIVHPGVDETIQATKLSDLIEQGNTHIWNYLGEKTFGEIGVAIDAMTLGDAVLIIEEDPVEAGDPPKSHAILIALKDSPVSQLGTNLPAAINDCLLSDIITIDENSPAMLRALSERGTKIGGLSEAIADLTVGELYPDQTTGALALIDPETKINDLPAAMTAALTTKTLGELQDAGIVSNVPEGLLDKTIQGLIDTYPTGGPGGP
jgi:hypothetical protein